VCEWILLNKPLIVFLIVTLLIVSASLPSSTVKAVDWWSQPTQLTTNTAYDITPSFSGDGSKIAFMSNRDGNFEIYVMNADGTSQTRLTNNAAYDGLPSFSGDGSKIAFFSDRDGNWEIYVMNVDGTGQTNLSNNPAADDNPSFSGDGSKIAFSSNRDGDFEIWVIRMDTLAPVTDDDYDGQWHTADFFITLTATDDVSGVTDTYYKINDGPTKTVGADGQPSITTEGENKLEYWSTDAAGHEELPHETLTGIKLDKNAPTLTPSVSVSNGTEIRSSTYTLNWNATDAGSGVDHFEVRLDGGEWQNIGAAQSHVFSGLSDGEHTLEVKAIDKAGKATVYSLNLIVNTSPIGGPGYLEEALLGVVAGVIVIAVGLTLYKIRKRPKKP